MSNSSAHARQGARWADLMEEEERSEEVDFASRGIPPLEGYFFRFFGL